MLSDLLRVLRALAIGLLLAPVLLAGSSVGIATAAGPMTQDMPEPPDSWQERTAAVERELQRRCGQNPQFAAATGQSHRIGHLLDIGQLTSQVILLSREYEGEP